MNPKGQLRRVVGSFRDSDVFAPCRRSRSDICDIVVAKLLAIEIDAIGIDKSKINTCLFAACDGLRPKADDDGRSGGDVDSRRERGGAIRIDIVFDTEAEFACMRGFRNNPAKSVELPRRRFFFKTCVRKLQGGFGGKSSAEEHSENMEMFHVGSNALFTYLHNGIGIIVMKDFLQNLRRIFNTSRNTRKKTAVIISCEMKEPALFH